MALDREMHLGPRHAAAVVADRDQCHPALGKLDADAARAGVERVLDQLLQRARGPLDDLSGRDLVDEMVWQAADRHAQGFTPIHHPGERTTSRHPSV